MWMMRWNVMECEFWFHGMREGISAEKYRQSIQKRWNYIYMVVVLCNVVPYPWRRWLPIPAIMTSGGCVRLGCHRDFRWVRSIGLASSLPVGTFGLPSSLPVGLQRRIAATDLLGDGLQMWTTATDCGFNVPG